MDVNWQTGEKTGNFGWYEIFLDLQKCRRMQFERFQGSFFVVIELPDE